MKSLLRQPPSSAKGKRGRGWRLRLTSTHITAVLGIFTSVPIPAAAGTTTPGSAHGDKLTRQTLRPSSSQPGTQTAGQTNFLFSKACYYHTDTMALSQIHPGSLSRTNLRPCKKDKAASHGNQTPTHTRAHPISPQDSAWERHRVISSHPACLHSGSDCEAPVRLQVKSLLR